MSSHEEWKPIEESNNIYSASNMGRIKNNITGNVLKPIDFSKGYKKVNLHLENGKRLTRQVHRLVAMAFIPNPENKPEVNHKNGNKSDNRVDNLEWVTSEENRKHAYDTGLQRHKDIRYSGYLYGVWKKQHKDNMCDEWQNYLKFYDWCYKNGYQNGKHVTVNNSCDIFSPSNCYISDKKVHPSKKYDCHGEKLDFKNICMKYGLTEGCIKYRMNKGMSLEEAVMIPKSKAKDNFLKVRLGKELYQHIFTEAQNNQITVSEYVRQLIDRDIRKKHELRRPDTKIAERG